jgi:hypothetical protein
MSGFRLIAAATAALLFGISPASADQSTPADQSPPPDKKAQADKNAQTDIGRVSTGPAQGESPAKRVVPSATINRADAIAEKEQAPNLIEVQPLSEIIKLPDINTAEALQRIPGISLETDSGEGRFVSIRGLDSDLNGTTYSGVRLPASNPSSPFGGGRAVAFDTFPTGIIGGVELTKTLRPDTDAEALGGSINLVPRTGAEHGGAPFLDTDFGYGYEPLRGTPVEHAEVSAGRSFDGGDGIGGLFAGANAFSAVFTAVYHEDKRGIDDLEESYTDQQSSADRAHLAVPAHPLVGLFGSRQQTLSRSQRSRLEQRLLAPAGLHSGPQQPQGLSSLSADRRRGTRTGHHRLAGTHPEQSRCDRG